MVICIVEPVFAGLLVSLFNKFILSGQCGSWVRQSCERTDEEAELTEQEREKEGEEEGEAVSSTNTTISDATIHTHCH